ncbi:MAG TPA: cobalt transporter CbiM [Caproiciproducens sp.]|nr:cobalt transporter CbiM [Caproiciproducens sp.]
MHIPDGYLSPATTIPAVAGMIPAWGVAFQKVKKTFSKKRIPALALCSAFSFLIMMFNVPVAGGSSAHAVGAVFIAILLGPWAAVISVSTALLIQALVFGDGGIMAYGINCLNMALVMPFAGYGVYKLIKGKSEPGTGRGLAAAFFGSYFGLNLAALLAAVEFGIQPLLFRAADGMPLYCPYPLSVTVPSMMAAHILIAGPIEGAVTAAAAAYLYQFAPQLFAAQKLNGAVEPKIPWIQRYKPVLLPFAALILLTPFGLLATGTAFGEWSTEEIKAQLGYIPQGITAAADWWNSLLPDYTVPALGEGRFGAAAGYVLSAAIGVLLIAALIFLTSKMVVKEQDKKEN